MSTAQSTAEVTHPAIKVASAWALVGVTSWADFAAMLAALYSLLLIGEWFWKRCLRPFAERRGWIARRLRRAADRGEDA